MQPRLPTPSLRLRQPRASRRDFARVVICIVAAACSSLPLAGCAATPASPRSERREIAFWPPLPAEPRIQFLTSFRFSSDVEAPRSELGRILFGESTETLPINKPYGVALWRGRIYVCDIRQDAVVILDLVAKQTRLLVARRLGGLAQPVDICIAQDGRKYVADIQRGSVFVFDAEDQTAGVIGWPGLQPSSVAVGGERLYITDFASQSVIVVNRDTGERLGSIGGPGSEDGQFVRPLGVAIDPDGNVVVCDVIRCRVQIFSPEGRLIRAFAEIGDTIGALARPKHIAVDDEGVVYVVDSAFQNVQLFNEEGQVLTFFGAAGAHPGAMDLPAGIDVSSDPADLEAVRQFVHPLFEVNRVIAVSNQFGMHKVALYALGRLRPGVTVQQLADSMARVPSGVQETEGVPGSPTPVLPEGKTGEPDEPPARKPPTPDPPQPKGGSAG